VIVSSLPNDADRFADAVARVKAGADVHRQASDLYAQLTGDERVGLLDGDTPWWQGLAEMRSGGYNRRPYVHGAVDRLGIPGTRFVDGPRGCVAGHGTAFPVSMARGATWDVELEERVGEAIGREIRAQGGNFFGGVCINLLRHPAWGRAQETYGDDPHHLGELGAALIRGAQRHVMACAKHFALNSMENARTVVDVQADEATLHDVYLPHFKRATDEGVAAIMASYNSVNGEWAGQNEYLLTTVLRELWQWDGITVTDFVFGIRDGVTSLAAGMDIEEPCAQQRAAHLRPALDDGTASWDWVERAGLRILATQLRSYAARTSIDGGPETMANDHHRALARTVAARSTVLLRNEPVQGSRLLPLDPAIASIAVIGRLAVAANMGDHGSSHVRPPSTVSPIDGLRAAYPNASVALVADDDIAAAVDAAAAADVAIIIAGYTAEDEGEYLGEGMNSPELMALFPPLPPEHAAQMPSSDTDSGDRTDATPFSAGGDRVTLTLRPFDEDLIRAVADANHRTVVAIVAGSAVMTEGWRDRVPAILMMWYAGMEGGHALADVLSGKANPSGRLPFSVPTSTEHLPYFDRDATSIVYDRFHGQRLLDRLGVAAAYPHGFGLSYTTFEITDALVTDRATDAILLQVTVRNTGQHGGHHVVQVYGRRSTGSYAGEHVLAGFAAIEVPAGGTAQVAVRVDLLPLAEWDPEARHRVRPAVRDVVLEVGSYAHDPASVIVDLNAQ
jgi:beta-glucosidase